MPRRSSLDSLAALHAALADPTRLRLLNLIAGREVCVCYFVEILDLPQPKISRHLAYLRKVGLVSARREGKWQHYRLQPPTDAAASAILETTLASLAARPDMKADVTRLNRACCSPTPLVTIAGAPLPTAV